VDRWQICRFTPPSHVMIEVGVALAGQGGYEAPAEVKGLQHRGGLHHARDRDLDVVLLGHGAQLPPQDKALTAQIREGQGKIFAEDLEMLERQQKQPAAPGPSADLLMLNIDAGGQSQGAGSPGRGRAVA
jgi:vanillate O-demethylase monooxygenase subunit